MPRLTSPSPSPAIRFAKPRAKLTTTLLLAALVGAGARADYPIVSHRYLADPTVMVHEGRVYLYCSNDDENVGHQEYMMQSLVCVSSDDLKNWTDHGVVFRVPENASWASRSWAPAAIERNGKFYLYFGNSGSGIGVAVGDSPTGPFNDPLGELLISWSTPGAGGEGMWLFDPYAFIDDDGQAYLYFGGNGESNVRIIKLNEDMISLDGAATSLTAPGFFEAAWMHKRVDTYYFSYSTNTANGLRIDYMTSDNPVSGFQYAGIVAGQPPSNNNNNHSGEFEFAGNWYHVYHNRYAANQAGDPPGFLRNLGLEPLFYNEDGSIQQIEYTRDGLTQVKALDPFQRVEGETMAGQSGIETEPCEEGGMNLTAISGGDSIQLRGVDFANGAGLFNARVASETGGSIELRLDSVDGPLLGTCSVPATGGPQVWSDASCPVDQELAQGAHDLFLVFAGEGDELLNLNWWTFEAPPPAPSDISARAVSKSELRIEWSPSPGADRYRLLRSSQLDGPFAVIADELADTSYTDPELSEDALYFYTVVAIGEAGESPQSSVASAAPKPNYEEWAAEQFPGESDPALIGPQSDADKDSRTNLLEYYTGTDPNRYDSGSFRIDLSTTEELRLSYHRSRELAAVDSKIQISTDLENWSDTTSSPSLVSEHDGYDLMQTEIPAEGDALFLRLVVRARP